MSVDDQSDVWRELREMKRKIARLESGSMLENSSITRGRMRFIGGTLRVDSGGRVEIVGTLSVEGTTDFIGPVTISGALAIDGNTTVNGNLDVDGPWSLDGAGDITGDVELTGDLNMPGTPGIRMIPGQGGDPARIRLGDTAGDAVIQGGDGLTGIVLPDGSAGYLVGSGGATIFYGLNGLGGYDHAVTVGSSGVSVVGMDPLPSGTSAQYVVADSNGRLYRSSGVGGGEDPSPGEDLGNFQWPFDPDTTVTSEYGPRTSPYTGFHEGIDFGMSPAVAGAPIIAAGDGVVAVSAFSNGWGNHVRITHSISAGDVSTLYVHMNATPLVSVGATVSKGDVIGYVGNTGNSYGAHLHFETWMTTSYGSHVDPRDFMAAYGPA